MYLFSFSALFLSCLSFAYANDTETEYEFSEDNNTCTKIIKFDEEVEQLSLVTYQKAEKTLCFRWPFICTEYKTKSKMVKKMIHVPKTKTVIECCAGYDRINGTCKPTCSMLCENGECTKPETCSCFAGWDGRNCTEECSAGQYGIGCAKKCLCENNATCDRMNGSCNCLPEYIGLFCETKCGEYCHNECGCENGGRCNTKSMACECLPGYAGQKCETLCKPGTYGLNCKLKCLCQPNSTDSCNPFSGECECSAGWSGTQCERPCKNSWGDQCQNRCHCGANGTCDAVTGVCSCRPGWHGKDCSQKCPPGFYAKDCKIKCPECAYQPGTCHHETGWCNCPVGSRGPQCDLECPPDTYGEDCNQVCLCMNNGTCDSVTGECSCSPGWTGQFCSYPCSSGTYGRNCSILCNCTSSSFCNRINGSCSDFYASEDFQLIKDEMEKYEHVSGNLYAALVIGILILVICCVLLIMFAAKKFKSRNLESKCCDVAYSYENKSPTASSGDNTTDKNGSEFMNPVYMEYENILEELPKPVKELETDAASSSTESVRAQKWSGQETMIEGARRVSFK